MYFMVCIYCIDECRMNDGIYDASKRWCPWRSIQEGFQFNHRYLYPYKGPKIGKNCYYEN